MPTSRYEAYALPEEPETKEEIAGDNRISRAIGELALTSKEDES